MSSWRKAAKSNQKTHRERSQLENRKHLGFLEKKKDYRNRAQDYHEKEDTLKLLRKRALDKNPDEFYHHMINSRIKDGEHFELEKGDEHTVEQIKLLQTQDIKYINMKRTMEMKKIRKMQSHLHMIDAADKVQNKHTFFLNDEEDPKTFDIAQRLNTHPALLERKSNRLRLSDLNNMNLPDISEEDLSIMKNACNKSYKELAKRIEREKELTVVQQKMELKRHLQDKKCLPPKRVKKGTKNCAPIYQWQYQRKK